MRGALSSMKKLSPLQFLLLVVPCAILNALGMDIFAPALPEMMMKLGTTEQKIQYVAITFTLAVGIGQPLIGILCDKFGRRKVMIASVFLFSFTSFATSLSQDIHSLAVFRFFQGLGACGSMVVTFALVNDLFEGQMAFRIFSYLGCALALTPMLAPMLGVGLMQAFGGWQSCFYFLGAFSAAALIICQFLLPETKPEDTQIPSFRSLKKDYTTVFRHRQFLTYTLMGTTGMTQLYLYFSIGNMLLIHELGLTPLAFSIAFAFNALLYLSANYLSTLIHNEGEPRKLCLAGTYLILFGSLLMGILKMTHGTTVANLIFTNSIMTIGVGLMIGPATGAALAPFKKLSGTASGLFGTLQYGSPALIGLVVTRYPIHSSMSIAVPMFLLALFSLAVARLCRNRPDPVLNPEP